MSADRHEVFMQRALNLARKGWGRTHPNPMVGAVIVHQDRVIGEGYHLRAGENHAEVNALADTVKPLPREATLYITLEPCSTQGKTAPCTDAILKSGLAHVVVGAIDPFPKHRGRGISVLREAGLQVETGVFEAECTDLNLLYNHWVSRNASLIAGKVATSIDGRIALKSGESKWITGSAARADVMKWRRLFPAIAVGSGTVKSDNPQLTSRMDDEEWCARRLIFDRSLSTLRHPLPSVYDDGFCDRTTVIADASADDDKVGKLRELGIRIWRYSHPYDAAFWPWLRKKLHQAGLLGVLCEGGSRLLSAMLAARELDYFFAYRAPTIFGDVEAVPSFSGREVIVMSDSIKLRTVRHNQLDDDQLMRGFVVYPES